LSIVVTYNAEKWLDNCVGSLLRSSVLTDIAIVDNKSSDKTVGLINEFYLDKVTYFYPLIENLGFGKAHNYVFSHVDLTKYDYVFLLNQDAEISPSGISKLLKVAQAQPDFGVLSPVHFFAGNKMDRWFKNYYDKPLGGTMVINGHPVRDVGFVNAAIWLMRVDVLIGIGGFDPLFSHYGEDVNYIHKVHAMNYKSVIVESVIGYHYRGQESTGLSRKPMPEIFYINQLVNLLNPNKSLVTGGVNLNIGATLKIVKSLIKNNPKEAFHVGKVTMKLMGMFFQIVRSRKPNK
jgi:GT2 family glycosyltransferase